MGVRYGEATEIHRRQQDADDENEPPAPVRRVEVLQRLDERLQRRDGLAAWWWWHLIVAAAADRGLDLFPLFRHDLGEKGRLDLHAPMHGRGRVL